MNPNTNVIRGNRNTALADQSGLSRELLQLLFDTVRYYSLILLDPKGKVAAAQRLKGWTADDIIGQRFYRFYPKKT